MTNLLAAAVITISSWYGAECEGKLMANGKPFNPAAMTPFGTQLRIVHNARSIKVTVTDRGPAKRLYRKGRRLDLSRAAFKQLAPLDKGLIRVRIFRLDKSR
jgi:rare lipoprotein A